MKGFANGYYRFCIWITRFAFVNLLWILFSLLGLLAFGVMPATASMFAVIRKWVRGEPDVPVFKTFWEAYRTEFLKANLLGYILLAIGYILYIDLQVLRAHDSVFYLVLSLVVLLLFFLYFVVLLYVFPLFVHFQLKTFQYIKWAIVIGIIHPILTVAMAAGIVIIYYITVRLIPGLMPFFTGSAIAFVMTWGASQTFSRFQQKEETDL